MLQAGSARDDDDDGDEWGLARRGKVGCLPRASEGLP